MKKIVFENTPENSFEKYFFTAPGSKSVTNRILIISALSEKSNNISNILLAEDSLIMINALSALGIKFEYDINNATLAKISKRNICSAEIYMGYAGTVYRFLLAYMLALRGHFILKGEPELHKRPITELIDSLNPVIEDGCITEIENALEVNISALKDKSKFIVNPQKSSQFLSALLLILPALKNIDCIETSGKTISKTYIDLTVKIMKETGVNVINENYSKFSIFNENYSFDNYNVDGDFSAASYFFAVAVISGKPVRVKNLDLSSEQGDKKLLYILKKMGCVIEYNTVEKYIEIIPPKKLKAAGVVDMSMMQDVVPTLAVAAVFVDGQTKIVNIENLKYKECDRFNAIIIELKKIGADIRYGADYIEINGNSEKKYARAVIDTYKDHRMAMAFSLLALKIPGITINEPDCVCKTFPDFFKQYLQIFENVAAGKEDYYSDIYLKQYSLFSKIIS